MSSQRFTLSLFLLLAAALPLSAAETILIDEDFSADPSADWQLNGGAVWDGVAGRVVVTPAVGNRAASMFFRTPLEINNFRLEAKVKLCCGNHADGMAITFIEGTEADTGRIGAGGGGMCVAGLTAGPQIVVEFDIWGNGAGCESCPADLRDGLSANHVGVEYSAIGFANNDCMPAAQTTNVACASDAQLGFSIYGNYTVDIVVQLQDAIVTVDVGSQDRNPVVPMRRVITKVFDDTYVPFVGLVGVTGSTGGNYAEQSIYNLKLTSLPPGTCLSPSCEAARSISTTQTRTLEWGTTEAWAAGSDVSVGITLSNVRAGVGACAKPAALKIEEQLPASWTATGISDGGAFDAGTGKITWNLAGAAIADGKTVTYTGKPAGTTITVFFAGTVAEPAPEAPVVGVGGEASLYAVDDIGFEGGGFITKWLLLGPFSQTGADNPGEAYMTRDFLTNGSVSELTYLPAEGDTITPDYNNAAASTGLAQTLTRPALNPVGVPTWLAWYDGDDLVNFEDSAFSDATTDEINQAMAYAVVYVENTTGQAIPCFAGCASDDSIQVILNGASYWAHSIPRGSGNPREVQDAPPVVLNPGVNRLMVKTFEGAGGFNFRLRFQDAAGQPITNGLRLSLTPPAGCSIPPVVATRTLTIDSEIFVEGIAQAAYVAGSDLSVSIALSGVRAAGDGCGAAGDVTIVEYLPAGWTAAGISNGGSFAAGKVTWSLTAAQLPSISALTYTASGPTAGPLMGIAGGMTEAGNTLSFGVGGQGTFPTDYAIRPDGFIATWLLLGAFQPGGDNPGFDAMRNDYLSDGALIDEATVMPMAGDEVDTDFGGAAYSTGLAPAPVGVNPNGIPMWIEWRDATEAIDLQNVQLYGTIDQVTAYAVCYVKPDVERQVTVACGSDDSIQILLDDGEVWINSIPRGWGGGAPLDVSPPFTLTASWHRLMVKCFEGGGDWNFGARFQTVEGAPITSGIQVSTLPPGTCVPLKALRSLTAPTSIDIEGIPTPAYREGDTVAAKLTLSELRQAGGGCPALNQVTIRETLPAGWTATNVSAPGTFAGGVVTWVLPVAQLAEGKELTYSASGPITGRAMVFNGEISEQGNVKRFYVAGASSVFTDASLLADGSVVAWLILGPYGQTVMNNAVAATQDALRADFLTDGVDITEADVMPAAGDTVATAYGSAAASTGLGLTTDPDINPAGVPTWYPWRDRDVQVNFQLNELYGVQDRVMAYAVSYLCVEPDEGVTITLAAGSDDGIQVLVDEVEAINSPIYRGWGGLQDISAPIPLAKGLHRIMAKVFEDGGDWNFGVGIRDELGQPFVSDVTVTLDPEGCGGAPPPEIAVLMGDCNGDKSVNIADAIYLLGYLFGGKPAPLCAKTADANDDDALNIADAIKILGYLFGSKEMLGPDGSVIISPANPTTCKGYAADGKDPGTNKPWFPPTIGNPPLPTCATQCK